MKERKVEYLGHLARGPVAQDYRATGPGATVPFHTVVRVGGVKVTRCSYRNWDWTLLGRARTRCPRCGCQLTKKEAT